MLKKVNYLNKSESVYSCDMCFRKISGANVIRLTEITPGNKNGRKLYDLCEHCSKAIKKGVVNYRNKILIAKKEKEINGEPK